MRVARAIGLLLVGTAVLLPAGASAETRYSEAGGCYSLASTDSGANPAGGQGLRFHATDLGSYLLERRSGKYLSALPGGDVAATQRPSNAGNWVVTNAPGGGFSLSPKSDPGQVLSAQGGDLALAPSSATGDRAGFDFEPASSCASFRDADLDVSGTPAGGDTSYGQVKGLMDGHMHWMNFEYLGGLFHCGRPWHPMGIEYALPDCSTIEGPQGSAAPVQNFLNFGSPVAPHDTTGYPDLTSWAHTNLTYEGNYYRWVERVWASGQRLMVMPVNENRVLCQLLPSHRNPCDEMATARLELDDINQLQDYVDAQAGGPGKGFFQIVSDPFEARQVINQGRLAVVLEMEISEPFGCTNVDAPTCDQAQVDAQLDDLYKRGVRSSLLLNKFDNPLVGVRFDSGPVGALINAGNKISANEFWSAETCKTPEHDNPIDGPPAPGSFADTILALFGVAPGTLPTYPPPPNCNTRGLTGLGAHVVDEMMKRGMIVNPDHMSQRGVDATLKLAEARHYSGVISPHGWMDPRNWPRIWALGGMAFPNSGSAADFVKVWRQYRPQRTPFMFGWAWGADLGGLAEQGSPPGPGDPQVQYPFKSLDGSVSVGRQKTGNRTFDYNTDGVATYGQYADWTAEVRDLGGQKIVDDLLNGPEAYLQMWERSVGVPETKCLPGSGKLKGKGLGKIKLRMDNRKLLDTAGQPLTRTQAWTYCVQGAGASAAKKGKKKKQRRASGGVTALLTPKGKVAMIASTSRGHRVRGIHPGDSASKLRGHARKSGKHVWTASLGKKNIAVYILKGKRVSTVAVATRKLRHRKTLRSYVRLIPKSGFTPRGTLLLNKRDPGDLEVRDASPLVHAFDPSRKLFYCQIGL